MITVAVPIELTEKDVATLATTFPRNTAPEAAALACKNLFSGFLGGGMLLSPDIVKRIDEMMGGQFEDPADLIALVQEATGRDGVRLEVRCSVDPVYEEALKEIAEIRGRDVTDIIQDALHMVLREGYAYSVTANVPHVAFSPEQYDDLRRALGKTEKGMITGADIMAAIDQAVANQVPALE